jgi:BMFP domain-containing protein YqiC
VLSRGVDHTYRRARQAQLAARSNEVEARSDAAAATGDLSAQVIMLKERILELQSDVQDWQAMAFEAEAEANQVKAQAERVPTLEEQVNQLGIALRASHDEHGGTTQSVDPWTILPSLESGSKDSAQVLFLRLQELTSERIVFTERALTSWKKARYPHPEEMRDALGKLSQVAIALYDGTERVMTHLDKWVREEFDLKVALQDDTIQKNKSLWKFIYEGRSHDRTPHVKVRDHAPHQEVGRIHFALDSENTRIIVDHVGVKLY